MANNDRHPSATCSEHIHIGPNVKGDEDADLTSLLEQTAQFGAGNREIIARIDASEVVVTYQYKMNFDAADVKIDDAPIRVEETKHEVVSKEVVDKFKPKITLKPVRDLFNDNVVYSCESYVDIVRLNNELPTVAEKLEFLATKKAVPLAKAFRTNMELLRPALTRLEQALEDQLSSKNTLQESIANAMGALRHADPQPERKDGALETWSDVNEASYIGPKTSLAVDHKQVFDWIEASSGKPVRNIKLLWRGTEHGFTAAAFHQRANSKVCGAYTDVAFKSSGAYIPGQVGKSFLFSVSTTDQATQHLLHNGQYALQGLAGYGPTFGGGADLYVCDNCNSQNGSYSNLPHSYQGVGKKTLMGTEDFSLDQIETYQVEF